MKKEYSLVPAAFLLISLSAMTGVYAYEKNEKTVTITKLEADLTGDGKSETVYLKGIPYQGENSYLKTIYLKVKTENDKTYTFPLEDGSKAGVQLVDLNDDGIKDLFATVETGGSGGISKHFLYTIKDNKEIDLTVPEPLEMESKFLNDYKAQIKMKNTGETYQFNLVDRKKFYNKMGLYHKGKINEPTELMVNPFSSLVPFSHSGGKVGLKGTQRVAGIANADTIAVVTSDWIYSDHQWKLLNVEVNEAKN